MIILEHRPVADGRKRDLGVDKPEHLVLVALVFVREDGSQGRFALCCLFNYAKVKFAGAVAQPAKFYLMMSAGEVEA